MPVCAKGNLLLLFLTFPICWDGINLDSPDHKSHTAYPGKRGCPTTHPKRLPNIAFKVAWALANKGSEDYRLSSDMPGMPAGQTIHGDWFEGWQPEIKDLWFTNCTSNTADCSVGNLGNGTRLKNPAN